MEEHKALQVSKPVDLDLLERFATTESKGGLFGRFFPAPAKPTFSRVDIVQIHHRFTAILVDRYIELYELEQAEDGTVKMTRVCDVDCGQSTNLSCTNWSTSLTGNPRSFLVVVNDSGLQLYLLDIKAKKLLKKSNYSQRALRAVAFMGETKLLAVADHSQLIKFDCSLSTLNYKAPVVKFTLSGVPSADVKSPSLLCGPSEELEDIIQYFFFTCEKEGESFIETAYVKEFLKHNDGIEEGQLYKIEQTESEKWVFKNARVLRQKDFFAILL